MTSRDTWGTPPSDIFLNTNSKWCTLIHWSALVGLPSTLVVFTTFALLSINSLEDSTSISTLNFLFKWEFYQRGSLVNQTTSSATASRQRETTLIEGGGCRSHPLVWLTDLAHTWQEQQYLEIEWVHAECLITWHAPETNLPDCTSIPVELVLNQQCHLLVLTQNLSKNIIALFCQ